MNRLFKFELVGLVGLGAIVVGLNEASAQVPELSRRFNHSNQKIVFTIFGTPRTQVPITISEPKPARKILKTDTCGYVLIPDAASYGQDFTINGQPINGTVTLQAPTSTTPSCVNGVAGQVSPSPNGNNAWNLGDGYIMAFTGTSGNGNARLVDLIYTDTQPRSKFISLNQCGLGSTTLSTSGITLDSSYQVAVGENPLSLMSATPQTQGALKCYGDAVIGVGGTPPPTVSKDWDDNIAFFGTPNASIEVGLEGAASSRSVTSDRCGGLTIGSISNPISVGSSFTIDGEAVDTTGYPVALKPSCKLIGGSYAYDVAPSGNFRTPQGLIFLKNTTLKTSGFGDRRIYNFGINGASARTVKLNQCGLGVIKNPTTSPFNANTSFVYGSTFTVGALPVTKSICTNIGTLASPDWQLYNLLN